MEATALGARTSVRVPMVWPHSSPVLAPVADMRATSDDASELVDQLHHGESVRILGSRGDWRYVQAEDHYLGWVRATVLLGDAGRTNGSGRVVSVALARLHRERDVASEVVGHLPAGTILPGPGPARPDGLGSWIPVDVTTRPSYLSTGDTVQVADLPHRPPTATDLIRTAEAFLGVPYLWGGTSAAGIDCSGYVQQVYRLNGMRLDRDADQQATLGRSVDRARAGDLLFFGAKTVTHVALSLGGDDFLNAPDIGRVVERGSLGGGRNLLAIRRYLMEETS